MDWSDWHSLKSDGTIPDELVPCELWQLRWLIEWDLTPPEESISESLTGRWRWNITQGSAKVFDSEVRVKGTAVWMGNLLIAWWVDAPNTEIRTYAPEKPPILGADVDAWTQRSDGTWQNPAEIGYVDGSSDGAGSMGREVPVYVDYNTCAYEIPLSDGAKIAVPFHNVGGFWLVKLANLQIRTAGLGGFDSMFDAAGIYRLAKPHSQRIWQEVSRDGGRTFETRRTPVRLVAPVICKEPTNALVIGGKVAEVGFGYITSDDDGLTWRDEGTPTLVFDASYSDFDLAVDKAGTKVGIARKNGKLWCRTGLDSYASTVQVCPAQRAFRLAVDLTTGGLVVDDGQGTRLQSLDGGRTWVALAAWA